MHILIVMSNTKPNRSVYEEDKKIVLRMLEDSTDASFEVFYKYFYNRIYIFILKKIKNIDLAKEIANDTFYKIYLNKSKINPDENFAAYFFTIAFNELRQNLRKKKI